MRGFDDIFLAPHSRHTGMNEQQIADNKELTVLAESDKAGSYIIMAEKGKKIFVAGHPEYDRDTLDKEYKRDLGKGLDIEVPYNYYKNDNPENLLQFPMQNPDTVCRLYRTDNTPVHNPLQPENDYKYEELLLPPDSLIHSFSS